MKIDLSKYPPGTKFKLDNGQLAMLVGDSPYRKGIYIVEYGDKGGYVDFSSQDGYIIFQDLHKYLVSFKCEDTTIGTTTIINPVHLTADDLLLLLRVQYVLGTLKGDSKPSQVLSWSKIEE